MPGAGRLLFHLHHCGVRVGLATSTPRATMERKLSAPAAQGLRGIFQARLWPSTLICECLSVSLAWAAPLQLQSPSHPLPPC